MGKKKISYDQFNRVKNLKNSASVLNNLFDKYHVAITTYDTLVEIYEWMLRKEYGVGKSRAMVNVAIKAVKGEMVSLEKMIQREMRHFNEHWKQLNKKYDIGVEKKEVRNEWIIL